MGHGWKRLSAHTCVDRHPIQFSNYLVSASASRARPAQSLNPAERTGCIIPKTRRLVRTEISSARQFASGTVPNAAPIALCLYEF